MSTSSFLLQGGTILYHERDDSITPLKNADLLIEGNLIKAIGSNLPGSEKTRVIDCTNKIISPGFIDTHHHLWQSQLKGRFNDDTLLDYMPKGNMASYAFSKEDMYWGECISSLLTHFQLRAFHAFCLTLTLSKAWVEGAMVGIWHHDFQW
jgi:cytosine/adenosine deaminase-related metal-dependent hydrolase